MLRERFRVHLSPKAKDENVVFWENYRVTVLSDRLFRIERNKERRFRDGATQSVWYRDMPVQDFRFTAEGERAVLETAACKLILRKEREGCLIALADGKLRKISNDGNLKGTYRTLDGCNGGYFDAPYIPEIPPHYIELENGVCSKSGVAVFDDAESLTFCENGEVIAERGEGTDEYVFAYGKDYRAAVRALYSITGYPPLVPRFALGNWWSRYKEYTQEEYMALLERFEEHGVPLTVATIDMDWHYSIHLDEQKKITESGKNTEFYGGNNGWTGYSWNTELFPDYRAMLREIQEKGLKITLNLHPADGVRWWEDQYVEMANAMGMDATKEEKIPFNIADNTFIENYFSILHKPYEREGVSFWWIDWQQGTQSKMQGLDPLWSLNHYHYLDNAADSLTPLILSRYSGVGAHRYPVGFSGDTYVTWNTVRYLPYFTATASNVGYTWWSHDIGGHMFGSKNDELYLRHVQFGVFSPINRLHCSCDPTMSKEPWFYQNGTGEIAMEWLRLRHRMIPWLYTMSYRTHKEGLALIEPLYYVWGVPEAYRMKNEYLFGGNVIVAPVTDKRQADGYARTPVWLPEGEWTDFFTGDRYFSPEGGKTYTMLRALDSIPVLVRSGGVLPLAAKGEKSCKNPEKLDVFIYEGNGKFTLYEDGREEGNTAFLQTEFTAEYQETDWACTQSLRICASGDTSVSPKERRLRIVFKNIPEGILRAFCKGEEISCKRLRADCVTAEIVFCGREVFLTVEYAKETTIERLKKRAEKVLLFAEGEYPEKEKTARAFSDVSSVEEYVRIVDEAKLPTAAKARLKEIL